MRTQITWSMHLLCMLFYFNHANAQPTSDYQCMVERIDTASNEPSSSRRYQEQEHLGKQFTVERRTGLMAGALKNSYTTKPIVIDHGSTEHSYKVVTTMRREEGVGLGSNIYALTINEFEQSPKKSFIFLRNDFVYFGHCEHF